ncbi:MAG: hypothetical protein AAF483_14125 [Planctomycetota bacterium]
MPMDMYDPSAGDFDELPDGEQRGFAEWREICHGALLNCAPVVGQSFAQQARQEWSDLSNAHGLRDLRIKAEFPNSVFSILLVWSIDFRLSEVHPDKDREQNLADFLNKVQINEVPFNQNWPIAQLGKLPIILATCSEALGGSPLTLQTCAFHLACEAEFLRRIRILRGIKPVNELIAFNDLIALRIIHSEAATESEAFDVISNCDLMGIPRFAYGMSQERVNKLMSAWGDTFRLRCHWVKIIKKQED